MTQERARYGASCTCPRGSGGRCPRSDPRQTTGSDLLHPQRGDLSNTRKLIVNLRYDGSDNKGLRHRIIVQSVRILKRGNNINRRGGERVALRPSTDRTFVVGIQYRIHQPSRRRLCRRRTAIDHLRFPNIMRDQHMGRLLDVRNSAVHWTLLSRADSCTAGTDGAGPWLDLPAVASERDASAYQGIHGGNTRQLMNGCIQQPEVRGIGRRSKVSQKLIGGVQSSCVIGGKTWVELQGG